MNSDREVMLDEDDLLSFAAFSDRNKPDYNLVVELKERAIRRIKTETRQLSRESDPQPLLGIFLDDKLLSVARLKRSISSKRANIPVNCREADAARLVGYLSRTFADCPCQTAWMRLPNEGFRIGARLDVVAGEQRSHRSVKMSFRLYNVSGGTKTVKIGLSDGTTVVKTLKRGKPVSVAAPIVMGEPDKQHGQYSMQPFTNLEGALRQGWTVTRKVDGKVTMRRNVDWPIETLTVVSAER